ncbi:type VII secretion target [Mycobacterium sp. PDNC021]|uniref:type VII secretion target n=1 Tax=Mycobacterium sp. PDNC021 TaxID=3391399 RepID=UPI003AABB781
MTAPLTVVVASLRETATELEDLASGLSNDGGGPRLSADAEPVAGLDSGQACREAGDAFLRRAQSLGQGMSAFAGKLDSAAYLYEHGDHAAAERIPFDVPEPKDERIGDDPGEPGYDPVNKYEDALRIAGLLDGTSGRYYREWLQNAAKKGVPPQVIVDIARQQHITPASFDVLKGMERVVDNNRTSSDPSDDNTYFLLPAGTSADAARRAALMTYILNAGTGYTKGNPNTDFAETPYTANEVQRILDRQSANSWSYEQVPRLAGSGGRFAATPNGMLMGLGGGFVQNQLSQQGGSTYGDVFLINIDHPADASDQLRKIIGSGQMWYDGPGGARQQDMDIDRILHHEERHSEQWAALGPAEFAKQYAISLGAERLTGRRNPFETNAGASDGGYS